MNTYPIRLNLSGMDPQNGWLPLAWAGLFPCNALLRRGLDSSKPESRPSATRRTLKKSRTRLPVAGHLPQSCPYPTLFF